MTYEELLALAPARTLIKLRQMRSWARRGYPTPLPDAPKRSVLTRYGYPDTTWIETGTFKGRTTRYLARVAPRVISLEPADELYRRAKSNLAAFANIELLNGTSEKIFPQLLPTLSGKLNFWLDGHFSAGATFKGDRNSPLYAELEEIEKQLARWEGVAIMIDDIRHCGPLRSPNESGYPTLKELIAWSERNELPWLIEHDIFVMASHFPKT